MQVNQGVLRVYGDIATDRFLGAEMIGPRTEHIAHLACMVTSNGVDRDTNARHAFLPPRD